MEDQGSIDRRSFFGSFKVEEDFTNRQIMRVVCAAVLYMVFATFLLGVFYTYVMNPAPNLVYSEPPSLFSFPQDFLNQWRGTAEIRSAIQIWIAGTLGMTMMFAIATGVVLSRKLAGPIHRLKSDLTRMKDGAHVFAITLRDNDELRDLAQLVNETLLAIEQRSQGHNAAAGDDLQVEQTMSDLTAIRTHLDSLPGETVAGAALDAWSSRMRDLVEKAENHAESARQH